MYKISEFSKITHLTVKALRYYDGENLLSPSYRDEATSYRYYDEKDFRKAQLLVLLRSLDFSIAEMKEVLANGETAADLTCYFEEKKKRTELRIEKEKELIRNLSLHIQPTGKEDKSMQTIEYSVERKEIPPVTVASIRFKGQYRDVGNYIGQIFKAVKNQAAGAPFNCYYDEEFKEEADIELCVPTKSLVHDSHVTARQLPAIKAICTTHIGRYETLNLAYKALLDYAAAHHLQCLTPSREVYIKGPGMIFRGNEDNYVTEIQIPVQERD